MEKFRKGTPYVKVKVLPIFHAPPLGKAKLVTNDVEKLALFNKPDILRFFLRLEAREGRP